MLHGRVAEAWHYNPFAFFALPVATFYIAIEALRNRYPRIHTYAVHPFAIVLIAIAILAFWILRNL